MQYLFDKQIFEVSIVPLIREFLCFYFGRPVLFISFQIKIEKLFSSI